MSIIGKKFEIDGTNKEVRSEDETFAYFDGGVAIKKYLLGTKYEEYMDPSTFFNSGSKTMMDIAEKIKKHDGPVNESVGGTQVNMQNVYQKPHGDDKVVPTVTKFDPTQNQHQHVQTQEYEFNNNNQPVVNNQQQNNYTHHQPVNNPPQQENPEEALFKKLKRNTKAVFDIKIEEMVPTADFIRMMNDNFETSIIDFLSKQAVDKLLRDPDKLRKQIKAQLETTVYGAPIEEEEEVIEKPTVSIIEEQVEEVIEKSTVSIIEEPVEEVIENPTVSIIAETVETQLVIEEQKEEIPVTPSPEEHLVPVVETKEIDLSSKE